LNFKQLPKLTPGDKVAILSPSFAAPGAWPHMYELGLQRVRQLFALEPVEYPTTKKIGASGSERAKDLIDAFENPDIKAVIASLGGDDQVTYIKYLPAEPFAQNPKAFFGYSDNTNFINHLWLNGVPSYYGASLFTQFAMQKRMDAFTVEYLNKAFFAGGWVELKSSPEYNEIGLQWDDPANLNKQRHYDVNDGWFWDGEEDTEGILWGGCLESIDELLKHAITLPTLEQFEEIVLVTETAEEIPTAAFVARIFRALGERGILERVKGLLVGRPKSWEFNNQKSLEERATYKAEQRDATLKMFRRYNKDAPVVQNLDVGHTDPQICMPFGKSVKINTSEQTIFADFS
jgi:muramoyltetrapeptide carboxypeptidase LdcA involved in peptidoglycan recycling